MADIIDSIEFSPLNTLGEDGIHQALKIYEDSFPLEERVPSQNLLKAIHKPDPRGSHLLHYQAMLAGKSVLGIGFISYDKPCRLGFLEYLAVRSDIRSSGLGSRFYQDLVELVKKDGLSSKKGPALGLVLEVERPEEAQSEAERSLRTRRIGFYKRNGAVQVPHLNLTAPPLHPGAPPVPYHILLHPLKELRWSRLLIEAVVATILGHGYGLAVNDPYYQAALQSIDLA